MTDLTCTATARNADGVSVSKQFTVSTQDSGSIVCNRSATPSTFAAQVAAAAAGETICLATGDYGTWAGTNKAITIAPQPGANPIMGLNLNTGDANFTIDGGHTEISASSRGMVRQSLSAFTSTGITLRTCLFLGNPGPSNITIKRCWFGPSSATPTDGAINVYGPTGGNSGIVIDRCWFRQMNGSGICVNLESDANVLVKNCYFYDCVSDGVRFGGGRHVVQDCEFELMHPHGTSYHSDAIQWYGGSGCTVKRSYFHDFEQGVCAFDGTSSNTITDNVLVQGTVPVSHFLSMYADSPGSLVEHNTMVGMDAWSHAGTYLCTRKTGGAVSTTSYRNNVGPVTDDGSNCSPAVNTNNMWAGAPSPNINGSPIFVGGPNPTTWAGFALAAGSPGKGRATDGLDVGIRLE